MRMLRLPILTAALALLVGAQAVPPAKPITLAQALAQARANSATFEAAVAAVGIAKAAGTQARAAVLPSVDFNGSYIYTQGNRYIANNGIHEYLSQGSVTEALNFGSAARIQQAKAGELLAAAEREITARGLDATVTADYYALLAAGHELTTAQQALADAEKYLKTSQELEQGGEVAHSDVIKAQLELEQRRGGLREAELARQQAQYQLGVILFPRFETNFTLVDDLDQAPPLPDFTRIQALARQRSPILAAAEAGLAQAQAGVGVARAGLLPDLTLNYTYGIDAAQFAVRDELGLPNLGSSATATLSVPLFDWGARRAQLAQSDLVRQRAARQLNFTERQWSGELASFYAEAETARGELAALAQSRQLAADSLRLTALRYRDGEATILELVDAQNSNTAARNAYDSGLARYHAALAQLQTLTGAF